VQSKEQENEGSEGDSGGAGIDKMGGTKWQDAAAAGADGRARGGGGEEMMDGVSVLAHVEGR